MAEKPSYRSLTQRLLALPEPRVLHRPHDARPVRGRGVPAPPISTTGSTPDPASAPFSPDASAAARPRAIPPAPARPSELVAADRAGRPPAEAT